MQVVFPVRRKLRVIDGKFFVLSLMTAVVFVSLPAHLSGGTQFVSKNQDMLLKDGWVYYQNVNRNVSYEITAATVYKVRQDGSQKSRIFDLKHDIKETDYTYNFEIFDISEDWLFFTKTVADADGSRSSNGGAMFKFNLITKNYIQLNKQNGHDPVMYKDFVWYMVDQYDKNMFIGSSLFKVNINTSEEIKLNDTVFKSNGRDRIGFAIYDDAIYVSETRYENGESVSYTYQLNLDGNLVRTYEDMDFIYSIIDEIIYYEIRSGQIYRVKTDGTEKNNISGNTLRKINPVVIDRVLYFSTSTGYLETKQDGIQNATREIFGNIFSINLADGTVKSLYSQEPVRLVSVLNDTIYFKRYNEASKSTSLHQMNLEGEDVKHRAF